MSVTIQHDEANNAYVLGGDIDGVFFPFVVAPGDTVKAKIEAVRAAETAANAPAAAASGQVTGNTGDDFDPSDFADNGDGTFTRKSDSVSGRFTPTGFQPTPAA
jgi:hypothetical protein